mgnify:CR=1 FL=1
MKLYDLKEFIYDVVAGYFTSANIVWAGEVSAKPKPPLVMLQMRNPTKEEFPIEYSDDDGTVKYYAASITLEVDIFSPGGKKTGDDTLADMMEFLLYIDSPQVTDDLFTADVSIEAAGPVQNATMPLDGVKYEFRSMVEFEVGYLQYASGAYGVKRSSDDLTYNPDTKTWAVATKPNAEEWKPTSAGGGAYEMVTADEPIMENTEIKEGS